MKRIIALFAILLSVGQAPASTLNLGPLALGVPTPFATFDTPGVFTDLFTFTVPGASYVGAAAANLGAFAALDTKLISIALISDPDGIPINGDDSLVTANVAVGNALVLLAPVTAGRYFLAITGEAVGPDGGVYFGNALIQAVPEPESWALFLAGIATVGSLMRRRGV